MAECKPCGSRRTGVYNPTGGRKKQWRVFFDAGQVRDYYEEADADRAVKRHSGRKVKLAG